MLVLEEGLCRRFLCIKRVAVFSEISFRFGGSVMISSRLKNRMALLHHQGIHMHSAETVKNIY